MQKHLDIIRPTQQAPRRRKLSKKQRIITGLVILLVVVIGTTAFLWLRFTNSSAAYIQQDKYQSLFLTNNQVYFGKLQRLNDGSYRITDVFYIQSDSQTNTTNQAATDPAAAATNKQPTLVKLGDELHGPTDEIIIRDDQVLFWENLKPDGKVAKAIEAYKDKK